MKPKFQTRHFTGTLLIALTLAAPVAQAANSAWNIDADGNWADATSPPWSAGSPGATTGTSSPDIATFGTSLTANRTVTVDANRNIGGITFSNTSGFGYSLVGGNILLSSGGLIQTSGGGSAHTDGISSAIEIQANSGTATFTAGSSTATRLLSIGGNVTGVATAGNTTALTIRGANTGANTVSGNISDGSAGGKLSITKSDAGTWSLTGSNSYTGGISINGGILSLGSAGALGSSGAISFGGGTLQYGASNTTDYSARFSTAAAQAFRINTNSQSITLATGLSSTGGSLAKSGAGTLTLTAANTYDGGTSVSGGTLLLSGGNDRLSITGNMSIGTGADADGINLGGNTQNTTGNVTVGRGTLSNGTINITGAGSYSLTAKANVTANLQGGVGTTLTVNNGSNTATLSGNNTFGGGVTITGTSTSVLSIGSANALGTGTLNFNGGTLGSSVGLGSITITNAITTTGANNYRFNPGSGTTLNITSDLAGASNGLNKGEAGSITLSGNNSYGGVTTISRGTLSVTSLANGGSSSSIGNSSNAASNLLIGGASGSNLSTLSYAGISAASTDRLFTAVQGPLGTSIANNATDSAHTLTFSSTGNIAFSGVGVRTISLGGANIGNNTFALQINDDGANATNFTKSGIGKWILSGTNTYTGPTTVSSGTLVINGTLANSPTTIKSAALLGGNGSSVGTVTMESGGGLAAKIADWTGAAGTGYDDLAVASFNAANVLMNLRIDTTGLVNFTESAKSFTILNTTGGISNFNPSNVTITTPGFIGTGTWSVAEVSNSLVISYSPGSGTSSFAGWASANGVIGGVNEDSDNDGIKNGVEYGLNTNPNGSDGAPGTYTGNVLSFDKRLLTSGNSDLSYRIEISPDLGITPWTEVSGYLTNDLSVISATIPNGPAKNFARLRIVVNP